MIMIEIFKGIQRIPYQVLYRVVKLPVHTTWKRCSKPFIGNVNRHNTGSLKNPEISFKFKYSCLYITQISCDHNNVYIKDTVYVKHCTKFGCKKVSRTQLIAFQYYSTPFEYFTVQINPNPYSMRAGELLPLDQRKNHFNSKGKQKLKNPQDNLSHSRWPNPY